MTQINPVFDNLLVKLLQKENKTSSGVVIAHNERNVEPKLVEIIEVGWGHPDKNNDYHGSHFKAGEKVYIEPTAGLPFPDGTYLVKENEILAKLKEL